MKKLFILLAFLFLPLFLVNCGGGGTSDTVSKAFEALMDDIDNNEIEVISVKWISFEGKHEKEKAEGVHYYIVYQDSSEGDKCFASVIISKESGKDEEINVNTDFSCQDDLDDRYNIDLSLMEFAAAFAQSLGSEYTYKEGTLSSNEISSALEKAKK